MPALAAIGRQLAQTRTPEEAIALYEACYPLLEQAMWSGTADFHALLADYQALFREQESLIAARGRDDRHHFIIGIPVADRPVHLDACLDSIHQVLERFGYGGKRHGIWHRIRVVVAEDSREPRNVDAHRALAEAYRRKGLDVHHLGFEEQAALLERLPDALRPRLARLLTDQPRDRLWRKGQAANRNLLYLKFREMTEAPSRTLYYLLDCDQSLCVNRVTAEGTEAVYAINYFHAFDRIFRTTDTLLLTGKMVGDPPVSPAVMVANFLEDVLAFFAQLARRAPDAACDFHGHAPPPSGDAAYHDMASLFGFDNRTAPYAYRCRLEGEHDHRACLADFAGRLACFFFGEHLTRGTVFAYGQGLTRLGPARTLYPGNYVARHAGLKYVIPFGHLRLRMSGPTAGRLIAAEIGARFATCNLPNLHRRIGGAGMEGDFRPGVESDATHIDLSDEFERQFFGDLMLFSAETLARVADVREPFPRERVEAVTLQKEAELLELYTRKHRAVAELAEALETRVFAEDGWWLGEPALAPSLTQIRAFLDNVRRNFGETARAWQQIRSAAHRARRREQIVDALTAYRAERQAWDALFGP